jgi:hypothetical protein
MDSIRHFQVGVRLKHPRIGPLSLWERARVRGCWNSDTKTPDLHRPGALFCPDESGLTGWRRRGRCSSRGCYWSRCGGGVRRAYRSCRRGRFGCSRCCWLRRCGFRRGRFFHCGFFRCCGFGRRLGSRFSGSGFRCGLGRWFRCSFGCRFSGRFGSGFGGNRFGCGFCCWLGGGRFRSRLGRCFCCGFSRRFGQRLGSGFCRWFGRCGFGCRFCCCSFRRHRLSFQTGQFFDLFGQCVDLAVERFDFIAARYTEARNRAVQALVESPFQLVPFAQCAIFHAADARLGRRSGVLGGIDFFADCGLGELLGFLAVFDQCIEELAAVSVDLRVHA